MLRLLSCGVGGKTEGSSEIFVMKSSRGDSNEHVELFILG